MKVTILMPVYNAEKYIASTIESILNQTFKDFEFLIINDASTDNSVKVIKSFRDPRIRLVHNEKNLNVEGTLNRGLELARGEYIARMDADDIAIQYRLEKEVDYLDQNADVGVVGGWINLFDKAEYVHEVPSEHEDIQCELLFTNVMMHPTVMIRKSFFDKYNLRYGEYRYAEDLELWMRCSFLFKLHNLPEVLLNYRISNTSVSQAHSDIQNQSINRIYSEYFGKLGVESNEELVMLHRKIGNKEPFTNINEVREAGKHLSRLIRGNQRKNLYPKRTFHKTVLKYWYTVGDKSRISSREKLVLFWKAFGAQYLIFSILSYRFTLKYLYLLIKGKGN